MLLFPASSLLEEQAQGSNARPCSASSQVFPHGLSFFFFSQMVTDHLLETAEQPKETKYLKAIS